MTAAAVRATSRADCLPSPARRPRRRAAIVLAGVVLAVAALFAPNLARLASTAREVGSPPLETIDLAERRALNVPAYFPFGVVEEGRQLGGSARNLESMVTNLQARGLDTVMFTNNEPGDVGLLGITDRLGFNVIFAPTVLYEQWWNRTVPADRQRAVDVISPLVQQLSAHSSVKGYSIADEPPMDARDKLTLATDVFRQLDPLRPSMATLIGLDRVPALASAAKPPVLVVNAYPVGDKNLPGSFAMNGFGYPWLDFVDYVRTVAASRTPQTPLWVILQSHRFKDELREPTPAEIRAQNWLAIGEGATGIFWFIYGSQQGWRGLADNPPLLSEVTELAKRVRPLRTLLLNAHKAPDDFTVHGDLGSYVSTLAGPQGELYAVVVNRDLVRPQTLTVGAPGKSGRLRELTAESCRVVDMNAPVMFEPGDGKVFELVPEGADTDLAGVPSYPVEYQVDTESWWAGHPLNLDAPCHLAVGAIVSPTPRLDVAQQFGGSIQAAIDALPATGGTVYFRPGSYDNDFKLVGKSNVHLVSDGGAVLTGGHSFVVGCAPALQYSTFNQLVHGRDADALGCATTKRIHNVYFKNIVFDGEGSATMAVYLAAARDVLFDSITFRNFRDPASGHDGLVSGGAVLDNIWFRDTHFVGNGRWALYLDGAHGSGVINSTIDHSFGSGGLLFLSNDDFSEDYNGNKVWDPDEIRFANHIVVANNTFGPQGRDTWIATAVSVKGADAFVTGNTVNGYAYRFAQFDSRCSQRWPDLNYEHYGHLVTNNRLFTSAVLVTVDGRFSGCAGGNVSRSGKYEVRDNIVADRSNFEQTVEELGPVDGPNVVAGNYAPPAEATQRERSGR